MLISYIGPHNPILDLSGIDTSKYKGHRTGGAAASSVSVLGANLNAIMRIISWRNSASFARFYYKSIEDPGEGPSSAGETNKNFCM